MKIPTITVFTPTYNRAYILEKCYKSLQKQTCMDFEWLVIDDGSEDNTKELVEKWMKEENSFKIRYIYKNNGGLHSGYNTAIANMNTELSVCIDSDDSMPEQGIESILKIWKGKKEDDIAGLVGLDYDMQGNLIGKLLPNKKKINAAKLLCIRGMGDKKYVMRNDLWKTVAPMPEFSGEKNFNPHYFVIKLSAKYKFVPVNQCFCLVDYQENGMSANIYHQYINSPRSFAELRKAILEVPGMAFYYRYKTAAHYVSSCLLAKKRNLFEEISCPLLVFFATPMGIIIYFTIKYKTSRDKNLGRKT